MKRLDTSNVIHFVDLYDKGVEDVCPVDRAQLLQRFHARDLSYVQDQEVEGELASGAKAFVKMWRALPAPMKWIGNLAHDRPYVISIMDKAYVSFLRYRPWLSETMRKWESGGK